MVKSSSSGHSKRAGVPQHQPVPIVALLNVEGKNGQEIEIFLYLIGNGYINTSCQKQVFQDAWNIL